MFYDKLFSSLDFTLPGAATGRRGFPKEAMVCAFIVMKCEGVSQIADLADYLDNNRIIAHYSRVGGLYIWSYVEWSIYIIGLMNSTPLVRQYDILSTSGVQFKMEQYRIFVCFQPMMPAKAVTSKVCKFRAAL